jgi:hypothetical protein
MSALGIVTTVISIVPSGAHSERSGSETHVLEYSEQPKAQQIGQRVRMVRNEWPWYSRLEDKEA